jgi:enoyl-CoA hydratase/carnithine racemase
MYQTLQYECADGIATVRFNRPTKLNAINPEMIDDLRKLVTNLRADPGARVVIFTGNGRAFCAGADIAALARVGGPVDFMSFIEGIQLTFNAIEDLDRPTIAAINGIAYGGGCEISLCCDFRVIAADTGIGVPEIKIGLLPGAGGTQRLPKMLPAAVAKQMIYTGDPLTAQQALQHGLVNEIAPAGEALEVAMQWARKLLKLPPVGIRCAKLLVDIAQNGSLKTGIEAERQAMGLLYATEDRKEGLAAFLERREAKFGGR